MSQPTEQQLQPNRMIFEKTGIETMNNTFERTFIKILTVLLLTISSANADIKDDIERRCIELESENLKYNSQIQVFTDRLQKIQNTDIALEINILNKEISEYPKKRENETYEEMEERNWEAKKRLEVIKAMNSDKNSITENLTLIRHNQNKLLLDYKQLCM